MDHWNHRVVRREHVDTGEVTFAIHEAHYDEVKVEAVTSEPIDVSGESVDDLRWVLEHMLKALDKPVLNYEEF